MCCVPRIVTAAGGLFETEREESNRREGCVCVCIQYVYCIYINIHSHRHRRIHMESKLREKEPGKKKQLTQVIQVGQYKQQDDVLT